ncbi:MAG: hypothetical protein JWN52_933 [Actinomycetia bacterium]|nr:hypothetical protein [Actinomycetes bacterium]
MTTPMITQVHPTEKLPTASGESVSVDVELVPVIRALQALDLHTLMCCQDVGEAMAGGGMWPLPDRWHTFLSGYAWLKMPVDAAQALLAKLSETPEFESRLTAKAPGGWQSQVWLGPTGLADYANIYFPREQIPDLTAALTA